MPQTQLANFTVSYLNSEEYHHVKREIWSEHCYYTEIENPAPTIIDVGAHIGLTTLYFAKHFPTAQIISLEPNPITYKILEENVWQNHLEGRVTCLSKAISGQASKQSFWLNSNPNDWQLNSNLNPTTWTNQPLPNSVQVETITLSSLLNQPVDLLKIDVEGNEFQLIKEAQRQLHNVGQFLIEFHPRAGNNLPDLLNLLKKHKFATTLWKQGKQVQANQARGLTMIKASNQTNSD